MILLYSAGLLAIAITFLAIGPTRTRAWIRLTFLLTLHPAFAQTHPTTVPMCHADDLSLATDDENGSFNGMSHSGTLLVLRNLSPAACSINPLPQISFSNADHKDSGVTVTLDTPFTRGPIVNGRRLPLGHGPVVLPIILAPGAEATASLRWVSGDVYAHSTCLTPSSLQVRIEGAPIATAFKRTVCGENPTHVTVTATRFALDPVYRP